MSEIVKICKIHGELKKNQIRKSDRRCLICYQAYKKNWDRLNKDKISEYDKKYYQKNKEKRIARAKAFQQTEKGKESTRQTGFKRRAELKDCYVKRILLQYDTSREVPKELIALKRITMQIKRHIKNEKKNK